MQNYECRVIRIPKTIDNDIVLTDHCPGYGSAAKYVAITCMEVCRDAKVYDVGSVTVIEVMGRNTGWLTASAALAVDGVFGPDLIYIPEVSSDLDVFISDVTKVYEKNGGALVVVSEGIKDKSGIHISS